MTPEDPRHGTEAGCREHYRHGQSACPPCLEAHRRANIMRQLYPHKRPSLGAQRRIQALQAIGYGRDRIAEEIGYSNGGALTYLMRSETMLASTFDRICEAYKRLSMVVPEGGGPERARTWARRHGYAPPLAWDNIDDPDERPHATEVRTLPTNPRDRLIAYNEERAEIGRQRLENIEWLHQMGCSTADIMARVGLPSWDALEQFLHRHKRRDLIAGLKPITRQTDHAARQDREAS